MRKPTFSITLLPLSVLGTTVSNEIVWQKNNYSVLIVNIGASGHTYRHTTVVDFVFDNYYWNQTEQQRIVFCTFEGKQRDENGEPVFQLS